MFSFLKRFTKKHSNKKTLKGDEEINECIDQLCEHFTLISARFHGDPESYTTSIIDRDFDGKTLTIDEFIPKGGNKRLREKEYVNLVTRLDGTRFSFECKLISATQEDDLPCFIVTYPQQIQSIQRRHSYRVSLSKAQSYPVNIHLLDGTVIRAILNDISVSGLSFRSDSNRRSGLSIDDAISISGLDLYGHGLNCNASVRRFIRLQSGFLIAVQFEDLERSQEVVIEQFVAKMQREKQGE